MALFPLPHQESFERKVLFASSDCCKNPSLKQNWCRWDGGKGKKEPYVRIYLYIIIYELWIYVYIIGIYINNHILVQFMNLHAICRLFSASITSNSFFQKFRCYSFSGTAHKPTLGYQINRQKSHTHKLLSWLLKHDTIKNWSFKRKLDFVFQLIQKLCCYHSKSEVFSFRSKTLPEAVFCHLNFLNKFFNFSKEPFWCKNPLYVWGNRKS